MTIIFALMISETLFFHMDFVREYGETITFINVMI